MSDGPKQKTVIGADTKVKGEMSFESDAQILGEFEGSVGAKGELHVADGATCRANIEATTVVVDGVVEGNIHAIESVRLSETARVRGDIVAGKMIVAEGAMIAGACHIGPDAREAAAPKPPMRQHMAEVKPVTPVHVKSGHHVRK